MTEVCVGKYYGLSGDNSIVALSIFIGDICRASNQIGNRATQTHKVVFVDYIAQEVTRAGTTTIKRYDGADALVACSTDYECL